MLDLDYGEDSRAEVDLNVVGTDAGTYVELQGTAEGKPFDRAALERLLGLADTGLASLFVAQREAIAKLKA
jgi:ribonuclease PH